MDLYRSGSVINSLTIVLQLVIDTENQNLDKTTETPMMVLLSLKKITILTKLTYFCSIRLQVSHASIVRNMIDKVTTWTSMYVKVSPRKKEYWGFSYICSSSIDGSPLCLSCNVLWSTYKVHPFLFFWKLQAVLINQILKRTCIITSWKEPLNMRNSCYNDIN